jgi:hypothetical protein
MNTPSTHNHGHTAGKEEKRTIDPYLGSYLKMGKLRPVVELAELKAELDLGCCAFAAWFLTPQFFGLSLTQETKPTPKFEPWI